MCCHSEVEVGDQTCYLTQSHCTDSGPASPSTEPLMPGILQDGHQSVNFSVTVKIQRFPDEVNVPE